MTALFPGMKPVCAFFLFYVSPQTFADVEPMGSSVPQLLEGPGGEPGRGSPESNAAVPNTTNNPEFVGHKADLQVCLSHINSLCLCLYLSLHLTTVKPIISLNKMTLISLIQFAELILI